MKRPRFQAAVTNKTSFNPIMKPPTLILPPGQLPGARKNFSNFSVKPAARRETPLEARDGPRPKVPATITMNITRTSIAGRFPQEEGREEEASIFAQALEIEPAHARSRAVGATARRHPSRHPPHRPRSSGWSRNGFRPTKVPPTNHTSSNYE